jgi:hypothetical protein
MSIELSNLKTAAFALAGLVLVGGAIVADAVGDRGTSGPTELTAAADTPSIRTTQTPRKAPANVANAPQEVPAAEEDLVDEGSGLDPSGIDPTGYDPSPQEEPSTGPEVGAAGTPVEELN